MREGCVTASGRGSRVVGGLSMVVVCLLVIDAVFSARAWAGSVRARPSAIPVSSSTEQSVAASARSLAVIGLYSDASDANEVDRLVAKTRQVLVRHGDYVVRDEKATRRYFESIPASEVTPGGMSPRGLVERAREHFYAFEFAEAVSLVTQAIEGLPAALEVGDELFDAYLLRAEIERVTHRKPASDKDLELAAGVAPWRESLDEAVYNPILSQRYSELRARLLRTAKTGEVLIRDPSFSSDPSIDSLSPGGRGPERGGNVGQHEVGAAKVYVNGVFYGRLAQDGTIMIHPLLAGHQRVVLLADDGGAKAVHAADLAAGGKVVIVAQWEKVVTPRNNSGIHVGMPDRGGIEDTINAAQVGKALGVERVLLVGISDQLVSGTLVTTNPAMAWAPESFAVMDLSANRIRVAGLLAKYAEGLAGVNVPQASAINTAQLKPPLVVGEAKKKKSFFKSGLGLGLIGLVLAGAGAGVALGMSGGGSSGGSSEDSTTTTISVSGSGPPSPRGSGP